MESALEKLDRLVKEGSKVVHFYYNYTKGIGVNVQVLLINKNANLEIVETNDKNETFELIKRAKDFLEKVK